MIKRPPLAFTVNPLDRGGNHRADSEWISSHAAADRARYLALREGEALLQNGHILWLHPMERAALKPADEAVFLGLQDGAPRFAVELAENAKPPAGAFENVRRTAHHLAPEEAGIIAHARSLLEWRKRHLFCAVCGAQTRYAEGGAKRECAACGADHFPRVDPVAIMWVTRGGRALLGRQSPWPPGVYSALAGFVEPGETLEDACRRETFEEAGVRVGAVRYVESQPWPFLSSLMIGLSAEAESGEIKIDPREIEDARWFSRDEIAAALDGRGGDLVMPPSAAIARRLAERWIDGEL